MVENNKTKYCRCEIELMLKYCSRISFDIFIMLSDNKILKLSHKEDESRETLVKYQEKGLKYFYITKQDYDNFLTDYNSEFKRASSSKLPPKKRMQVLVDSFSFAQEAARNMELNESSIGILNEVNAGAFKLLHSVPVVKDLFADKLNDCDAGHVQKNILAGYIASAMISTFDWQSKSIKEKAAFAALLQDIILSNEELLEMKSAKKENSDVSLKITNHPLETVKMLNKYPQLISNDILTIIEQHHERPNGNGYPHNLPYQNISFLSAICIIANHFSELYIDEKFDMEKKEEYIENLMENYNKGHFKKAMTSLKSILGMTPVVSPISNIVLSKL